RPGVAAEEAQARAAGAREGRGAARRLLRRAGRPARSEHADRRHRRDVGGVRRELLGDAALARRARLFLLRSRRPRRVDAPHAPRNPGARRRAVLITLLLMDALRSKGNIAAAIFLLGAATYGCPGDSAAQPGDSGADASSYVETGGADAGDAG